MRVVVTAGPTREYIDPVRFITNASSGRMGWAVATAAARAGHEVTLLSGHVAQPGPPGCRIVTFDSVADLKAALREHFAACEALVMAAAVGDFRPARPATEKIPRAGGPMTLHLVPTEDVLAEVAGRKRSDQVIVAFAVEGGPRERAEAKARAKLAAKGADYVVVNGPGAMGQEASEACILSAAGVALPWGRRLKETLAEHIVKLLEAKAGKQ